MERNAALIMHEVAFGNDKIEVIEQGNELLVTMRPLCERIGLDWESQRQLIQRDEILREVACTVKATSIGKDGKNYPVEMVSLPIQYLNGWLFKVDPVRYEGELKEKLIRYKKECYQVLFERFFGKRDDYSYVDELERRTKAINAELKALKADDAFKEKVKRETTDVMRGKKKIEDLNGYPKLKEAVEERLNDPATPQYQKTDVERFWETVLKPRTDCDQNIFISSNEIYNDFMMFIKKTGNAMPTLSKEGFFKSLKKLCPIMQRVKKTKHPRLYGYLIPCLPKNA